MRKSILEKRLKRLIAKKTELTERCNASESAKEVRELTDEVRDVNAEIEETQEELEEIKAEEERQAQAKNETREGVPEGAKLVNGELKGSYKQNESRDNADPFGTMEYRKAFMAYAQSGTPIPANLVQRDGTPANTSTLGATIPTTVLNEFINEIRKVYGTLYSKVRKLNIQGAVKVPIAQLQATFKWVSEGTVAPSEDAGTINDYVEFSYNMAEVRVSQTLLSSIVTLDIFEREIVRVMLVACLQAMNIGIVKGTGNGQMLGILNDPRVAATGNVITMTASEFGNWTAWKKKFFAKLPLGYRNGEFIFPLGTVDSYLETMADANNNPIFRQATGLEVNDGDAANPNGRFFGRDISLVEPDVIADFDSASSGDVVGIFWQPEEYAINTNMAFGMRRWFDEDRNEWVNKMLTVVDGKVLNPKGIWIIKKA